MKAFDFAIVGAGIAGASLAWRLAPQARVVLLEREAQPGLHATGRSAAMFIASYGSPGARALTRASQAFYTRPPAGFCDGPVLTPRGMLCVATATQLDALARLRDEMAAVGAPLQPLTGAQAVARVPCLRPEQVAAALYEDDAQDIDVHRLHQGFLRGARAQGAELRCDAGLTAARRDADGWTLTLADGQGLRAAVVVNAAGAWADGVAQACGVAPLGLVPRRRSAFTFRPPEGLAAAALSRWPAVIGAAEDFYFKPDAGQLMGSPANADDTLAHDVVPEELDIAQGIHAIESMTTLQIRRPTSTWAGLRTFAPDGELAIGWDDAVPGFFWLAGQGGYGIQSAAGASALAAALLQQQPLPDELLRHGVQPEVFAVQRLR